MPKIKFFLFILLAFLLNSTALAAEKPASNISNTYWVTNRKPLNEFGVDVFFSYSKDPNQISQIITPNLPHLEISKDAQLLIAYKSDGSIYLSGLASTGKRSIDENGIEGYETESGFHRVLGTFEKVPWSKNPSIFLTDAILIRENEKYIHSLPNYGKYKDYEEYLGQTASHGCIRISRWTAFKLRRCVESCKSWQNQTIIVYIFDTKNDFLKRYPKTLKRLGKGKFLLVTNWSGVSDIYGKNFKIFYLSKKNNYAVIKPITKK